MREKDSNRRKKLERVLLAVAEPRILGQAPQNKRTEGRADRMRNLLHSGHTGRRRRHKRRTLGAGGKAIAKIRRPLTLPEDKARDGEHNDRT
jgi:hypothetical protein